MTVVNVLAKKITGLFIGILATFRRLLCFLHVVRHRKNSGSLLPMTTNQMSILTHSETQPMQSLPSNDYEELESWDSWGGNQQSTEAASTNQNLVGNHSYNNHRTGSNKESDNESDGDFFQDMVPQVKKPVKILIRKKEDTEQANTFSSRLAMSTVIPQVADGQELGQWDESESAWSSEAMEDLSWQAENALKETKQKERLRRQAEQQQKKIQKERERKQRRDIQFTAVKLS
ncbi:hypothetical protein LSH36_1027g01018 [Paralvinella palmiformis]|uniref:Receptor-binding cancer antigen expressed on SiSo cells n=1 Tax=Paralvinella palmiformis TaxID=53620 RepID=A0AAD9IWF9_9ANNE|nr:hypothetical protein LSH36_1027g01018 [Paralvinella palmiformis]